MNMGPRTWYQVPSRDLRYPEDPHLQYGLPPMSQAGMKRNAEGAGLDMMEPPESSDEDSTDQKPLIHGHLGDHDDFPPGIGRGKQSPANTPVPQGKKTKGRVKIKMEFIDNKLRRYTTFSKRKTGIMKKAYELSTLTGTQVMLLVASETGHVYTFATKKLQPMITSEEGKSLIQTCLNSPDPPSSSKGQPVDQRMSATGFEEPDLTYTLPTAAPASAPPPPPVHNAEGSSRSGVEVKVASPSTNPASPEDRRFPIHEGASFYNSERHRDASPEFDARQARPRSPSDHARPHFYQESQRISPYRSDSPKYHTIAPRSADRRFGRDPALRERSRSASPQQHSRKYVVASSEHSSRHSSGNNNNRHNSPPPSHHYHHLSSRHHNASPPPPSHHHHQ